MALANDNIIGTSIRLFFNMKCHGLKQLLHVPFGHPWCCFMLKKITDISWANACTVLNIGLLYEAMSIGMQCLGIPNSRINGHRTPQ
mgnify:CR=1 FL=1